MNTRPRQKTLLDIQYRLREMLPDTLSDPCTLAIIDFGDQSQISNDKQIIVGTPALAGSDLLEVWRTMSFPKMVSWVISITAGLLH